MSSLQSSNVNNVLIIGEEVGQGPSSAAITNRVPESIKSFPIELRKNLLKEFDDESKFEIQKDIESILCEVTHLEKERIKNAQILIENGEYHLAHDLLRGVLQKNSYNTEAIRLMGQSLLGMGQTQSAIKCFKSLVKIDTNFESLSMLAQAYYASDEDEKAIEFYFRALEENVIAEAGLFDVYKNIGNLYTRSGELDLAEEFFNKAFTLNPDSDVLLVNFGTLEIQRGHWDVAVNRFRSAVVKNVDNDKAWLGLALVHRQFGDLDLAWANIEKCLDKNIVNRVAVNLLIQWSVKDNKIESTISRLEDYLDRYFEDEEISLVLAQFFYSLGRLKSSRMELERTISLNPMNETALILKRQVDLELKLQSEQFNEA